MAKQVVYQTIWTDQYTQMVNITKQIEEVVQSSGVQNGMVTVLSMHTTAGITVNEGLECLEQDIDEFLTKLVPESAPYHHARLLPDYGSTAGNPTGHLKAMLVGNHCHLLIQNGVLEKGSAQEVYFYEFDGPSKRTYCVILDDFDKTFS
ncbi:secondary thiamine-phosphate synthase enzyme YjbQ [Neobacillus sp. OS1-32]|jgi:secondary thiamine-phosphate synthase enzyme|uniref:secondary thiamine-phosphate synthase enzyme YjbQ n=1 Tax=Neobacillus sp. OS1-32 TaxID=3070682 RepID=UPI0027E129FB|nr:secondary thiamine-phosphate synthase enzyme YjbQ [Neobacillus sp. OS1-32]WML32208.1 secondary thiamine-phosphate synthase enzyme YjbQ [Neobacillus sp. OS1-32]